MKKCMTIIVALLMCVFMVMPVTAHPSRVVDDADLLTDSQEDALSQLLDEISERRSFDVVVLTVDATNGQDIQSFADDYYDNNGYGWGTDYDGAILVVNMGSREYYISTCGYGIEVMTDTLIEYMADEFVPYLSNGEYDIAFFAFADMCDYFVGEARSGAGKVADYDGDGYNDYGDDVSTDVYGDDIYVDEYYDGDYEPSYNSTAYVVKGFVTIFVVCLIIGFFVAFVPMIRLKRQMKTVAMKAAASDYVKPGSKRITKSRDAFLYSNVTRMPKPKQDSNSKGGGGTSFGGGVHIGSSGRSHGGGGGRF